MFRFALSGCFTECFTLRYVIESYHADEQVVVPPECQVSRVFPCLRSCSSSLTDVVRSNEVVIMVLRGRGYCMVKHRRVYSIGRMTAPYLGRSTVRTFSGF